MEKYRLPKPGECYRHFKGRRYQVLTVARHTEREETLVIYEGLYGDHPVFARPVEMFCGKVDKTKFPDVVQKKRFELEEETIVVDHGNKSMIYEFLELASNAEKLKYLQQKENQITEDFLSTVALSLDFTETSDILEIRYQELLKYLTMLSKYDRRI